MDLPHFELLALGQFRQGVLAGDFGPGSPPTFSCTRRWDSNPPPPPTDARTPSEPASMRCVSPLIEPPVGCHDSFVRAANTPDGPATKPDCSVGLFLQGRNCQGKRRILGNALAALPAFIPSLLRSLVPPTATRLSPLTTEGAPCVPPVDVLHFVIPLWRSFFPSGSR